MVNILATSDSNILSAAQLPRGLHRAMLSTIFFGYKRVAKLKVYFVSLD